MRPPVDFPHGVCLISLLGLSILACGSSAMPSSQTVGHELTSTIAPSPITGTATVVIVPSVSASTPGSSKAGVNFKIVVIVDTQSGPVTREQAQSVLTEAGGFLQQFVPINLEMMDFVEDGSGGKPQDIAGRYLASHSPAGPNGILIFSAGEGGQAKLQNGYGFSVSAPSGFRNAFVSPLIGAGQIYVAVVPYGLRYMPCGYGGSDTLPGATSVDGECRDKPGTACVQKNGYSMCSDAAGNLYTSTPTHFTSSMIIHAYLHLFSPGGDNDNYATPECNARMGYPNGFFDLQESQYYNGICPFVYENFLTAYHP